jgi:hypothetical protein
MEREVDDFIASIERDGIAKLDRNQVIQERFLHVMMKNIDELKEKFVELEARIVALER